MTLVIAYGYRACQPTLRARVRIPASHLFCLSSVYPFLFQLHSLFAGLSLFLFNLRFNKLILLPFSSTSSIINSFFPSAPTPNNFRTAGSLKRYFLLFFPLGSFFQQLDLNPGRLAAKRLRYRCTIPSPQLFKVK